MGQVVVKECRVGVVFKLRVGVRYLHSDLSWGGVFYVCTPGEGCNSGQTRSKLSLVTAHGSRFLITALTLMEG